VKDAGREILRDYQTEKRGKLKDDALVAIDGRRQMLVGKSQQHYGTAGDATEKDAEKFAGRTRYVAASPLRIRRNTAIRLGRFVFIPKGGTR
jgi:uncharacterized protein YjbJ (UPF0337 family)